MRPLSKFAVLTAVFVSQTLAGNSSNAKAACSSLYSSLGPSVVQSNSTQYEAAITGAWNLLNERFRPTCIVFPTEASHVQTAMKAIYTAGAQYAIQSGGHSGMEGWNTIQDGVLILFSKMKDVSYDLVNDTITLQPGVRWDEAISTLAPQGVAPVGGRQGDVGTSLLLGGGHSFLSPAHGFASDNIKEVDAVLANGTLITANAGNEYADLFRALKGGGSRFGIVTRYELFAVHTGTNADKNWFGGTIVYDSSFAQAVFNATAKYVAQVTDPKAVLLSTIVDTIVNGSTTSAVIIQTFYNGSSLPTDVFGDFLSIPSLQKSLGPLSYQEIMSVLPADLGRGAVQHFGASALVGDAQLYLDALSHYRNFTNAFASELAVGGLIFTPVLQQQINAGRERGGNAISPPDGGYVSVFVSHQLTNGSTTIGSAIQQGFDLLLEQIPRSPGKPLFLNECDKRQNVYETYGDYEFLKRTYAKYDSTRFNVEHMEGPTGL